MREPNEVNINQDITGLMFIRFPGSLCDNNIISLKKNRYFQTIRSLVNTMYTANVYAAFLRKIKIEYYYIMAKWYTFSTNINLSCYFH